MKDSRQNLLLIIINLFFIYITHIWIEFFYNSTFNVDFSKYFDYINYFLSVDANIDYGQGVLYYFLISTILKNRLDVVELQNLDLIISSSVHNANLFLFLIGLFGIFNLLKVKGVNKKTIYLSTIMLMFFPQAIYMRAVMKPEILCFAMLPWCLYFIEKYLIKKNLVFLFFAIPFLVVIINTKASAAGMVLLYLLFSYFKILKNLKLKQIIILFFVFVLLVALIQIENFNITKTLPFDRPYDSEFDYKANYSILFRFSPTEIFRSPFFDFDYQQNYYSKNSQSVINLIILDSFGDYFNQLFDSEINYFSKNRKNFLVNDSEIFINDKREINYKGPLSNLLVVKINAIRKYLSSLFSIIFYIVAARLCFVDRNNKYYYLMPLFGVFILYLNAIGIPSNNYNPFKGDTFKAFYFSFFLCITFAFVTSRILNSKTSFRIPLVLIFIISVIFISGHPKQNSQNESERLIIANEYSLFCNINNFLFFENELLKSIHPTGNILGFKSNCSDVSVGDERFNIDRNEHDIANENICLNKNGGLGKKLDDELSNSVECRIYAMELAKVSDNLKVPLISLAIFIICIVIIFFRNKEYEAIFNDNQKT